MRDPNHSGWLSAGKIGDVESSNGLTNHNNKNIFNIVDMFRSY